MMSFTIGKSWRLFAVLMGLLTLFASPSMRAEEKNQLSGELELSLRRCVETKPGSGQFHTRIVNQSWKAKETAVIVCDMWDLHHCLNATRRVAEMAPRMNQVLAEARRQGAVIIHAPSSCMETYRDQPARRRAQNAPTAKNHPPDIDQWCHTIPAEEKGKYPIDQSDGGEDDDPQEHAQWAKKLERIGRNPRAPWKSQIASLTISNEDYISDSGKEVWNILQHKGIDNVILVGVHTNMCVLGRPFGLRNMAKNGKNVVLMRDMTDTMYNPAREPYVSHFTGTDLIVEHIEKWVCPTITSSQLLGGKPFRFKNDKRPHVVIVTAEREYQTNQTLPPFALSQLGKGFRVSFVHANETDRNDLPGLEILDQADVALISVRRRALPKPQMDALRRFVESGKPLVGIRTANHAFSLRGKQPPTGRVVWESFDQQVIGGNYTGHHGKGPRIQVSAAKNAQSHPLLLGVDVKQFAGYGSLYKVSPLEKSAQQLLIGVAGDKPAEPIAWINTSQFGGKVFYTSLGHPEDFKQPAFGRLLRNALEWAAKR